MPIVYSSSEIPSFARAEAYDFSSSKTSVAIYRELNKIAEEIERWRDENS